MTAMDSVNHNVTADEQLARDVDSYGSKGTFCSFFKGETTCFSSQLALTSLPVHTDYIHRFFNIL